MAVRRQVKKTGKDRDGDIISLCNSGQTWTPRRKADAIADIESKQIEYFVHEPGTNPVDVRVVTRDGRKHLQTTADHSSKNNLDNLPDC